MAIVEAADVALAIALGALIIHWAVERQRLRRFVHNLGALPGDRRRLALEVAGRLFIQMKKGNDDPPYLVKALASLGATPGAVIHRGGCCSGISRLYVLCLSQLNIRAHQLTVYHRMGRAQHCLVEVRLRDGPLIADPLYGLYYTDESGRPIGLQHLQTGAKPLFAPLPHSDRSAYPHGDYYDFDFTLSRTANWTKSWYRRQAYRFLTTVTLGGIDRLRLPVTLEWPQVLLGTLVAVTAVVIHASASLLRWIVAS